MKKNLRGAMGVCLVAAIVSNAAPASAYDYTTHSRIVEEAVYIMQQVPANATPPAPAGVSEQNWSAFLLAAARTPALLGVLKTGLPKSLPTSEPTPLLQFAPSADPPPTSEGYPFNDRMGNCQVDSRDNLANAGDFRIEDFHYDPGRSAPCGVTLDTKDPSSPLRTVLGWHAGKVDDNFQDVVMWYRPTNAVLFGAIKHAAGRAFEEVTGALLIPFVCVWEFFSSGSCNTDDAEDLATKADPINYVDSWVPGIGDVYGSDYTGLWHFIDVSAGAGQYNDIRGMLYENAGRDHPGVVDVGIMAFSDITGLSLKQTASDGDNNYGKYDRVKRNDLSWQATTIGHLEWSPLDHLAAYGWDTYKADLSSAHGLGWVLHALGDAAEPHHITGTTSWGHRPYEDYVDKNLDNILMLVDPTGNPSIPAGSAAAQHNRILALAYPYFVTLGSGGVTQPAPVAAIESLVQTLAQGTYQKVRAADWPFNDSASLNYVLGGSFKDGAINEYVGDDAQMTDVIEPSVGAVMAFLMYAANFAQDPGLNPDTSCPTNTHFEPPGQCAPGAAPTPPVVVALAGVCADDGVCGADAGSTVPDAGVGAPCSTSADCVVGTCTSGTCTNECSASQPCGKGVCQDATCCSLDVCQTASDCCGRSDCTNNVCIAQVH